MIFFFIPLFVIFFAIFFTVFINIMIKIAKSQTKNSQNNISNQKIENTIKEVDEIAQIMKKRTHTYCSYCGTKIDIDARKCPECGAKVKE